MDKTYKLGDIKVFKVNKDYKTPSTPTSTTLKGTKTTTHTGVVSTTIRKAVTTIKGMENESGKDGESKDKGPCCIPFLTGILGLTFSIILGIPYLLISKKRENDG